jgi:hypothetical protein
MRVGEVMTTNVEVIGSNAPLEEAAGANGFSRQS